METPFMPQDTSTSDPVSYICTCPAGTSAGGQVLLFYRYWEKLPTLPSEHVTDAQDSKALAEFHRELCSRFALSGKLRIATEGFNITLGGTNPSIARYIEACRPHWSFSGIDLSTAEARDAYFKPTPGCACVFGGEASVKVTAEITPLGITNYSPSPSSWSNVVSLPPEEFHKLCKDGSIPLIDVRNHYESRIGYFATGAGAAVRPAIRRFSQWPGYVARHVLGNELFKNSTGVATYCTGGIRCEKGARWMQEALAAESNSKKGDAPVYTLDGGIVAYQAWMEREIEAGRLEPEDSFFKGKNYVFDARGAIAHAGSGEQVSTCHGCSKPEDRLGKCKEAGCHLVLVVCEDCRELSCCDGCQQMEAGPKRRGMCKCESERERSLWGDAGAKISLKSAKSKTSQHNATPRRPLRL